MTDEAPVEAPRDPLKRLRSLREAAGREVEGLARELHIDASLLRALEAGDFERLGAPVYVKGHLKRYAQAVGANADELLADYDALHASDAPPPVVPSKPSARPPALIPAWVWLVVGLGIALVALLAGFILGGNEAPAVRREAPPPAAASEPAAAVAAPQAVVTEALPLPPRSEPEAPPTAEPTAAVVTEAPAPEPAPSGVLNVQLRYSDDCWTEIRDTSGRVLFSGTGRAGATESVSGQGPLTIVVGNRNAVSVEVDGAPFAIPTGAVRRRTARFTVPLP